MAHCHSNSLILRSIEELVAKRKRRDHETVVLHAHKHHGLSVEDGRESISFLMNKGFVINKRTQAGYISLFVNEDVKNSDPIVDVPADNISTADVGDNHNDPFLRFLDTVETPTKEMPRQFQFLPRGDTSPQEHFLAVIGKLVESNSQLNELVNTERNNNRSLTNENANLKIELERRKAAAQREFLKAPSIAESVAKHDNNGNEIGSQESYVPRVISQELEQQLKAVQIVKHREYLLLKSNEEACRKAEESDVQREKSRVVAIAQNKTTTDATIDQRAKRNGGTTKKGKNQNKQNKEKVISSSSQHSAASTSTTTANTTSSTSESTAHQQQQQPHWPKGTVLIAGDSIISGINEKCFEGPNYIKVRSFPGATIADMKDYLKPLLRKNPTTLILHVGTNDASNGKENADEIFNDLLELKNEILRTLPSCHVIISMPTLRKDNTKANGKVRVLNQKIAAHGMERINNNNIVDTDLGRKKLHLNMKGTDKLAKNFTNFLRNL